MPSTAPACRRATTCTPCSPAGSRRSSGCCPGFADDLIAAGAVEIAIPTEVLWLSPAGWMQRFSANVIG